MKEFASESIIDAWISLFRAQSTAFEYIEKQLKAESLPPLSWYDILWELDRMPDNGIRQYELKKRLLFPQYGLSRLLTRLNVAGLVDKDICTSDGRGHILRITHKGRTLRQKMWPIYAQSLQTIIGDQLSEDEAQQLSRLLKKIRN